MNVLIIDTETTNSIEQPLPYDVGYLILDASTGEILVERSFVVSEIFFDENLMQVAYFADKIPQYLQDIKEKRRKVKTICGIRKQIKEDMKNYQVNRVGAYNMGFDNRATKNDIRYISGSMVRWFFPYGTELFCIWNMACTSILSTANFINWAIENSHVSDSGNIRTSAEICYRYLTKNNDFEESHTGLEDCRIEAAIFLAVLRSGLEYNYKVAYNCWRHPQMKRVELGL